MRGEKIYCMGFMPLENEPENVGAESIQTVRTEGQRQETKMKQGYHKTSKKHQ